jgi:hypothetical protein
MQTRQQSIKNKTSRNYMFWPLIWVSISIAFFICVIYSQTTKGIMDLSLAMILFSIVLFIVAMYII